MVNFTVRALQTLKSTPGPHLALFLEEVGSVDEHDGEVVYKQQTIKDSSKQREDLEHTKTLFIDEVMKNINTRFPQVVLMTAMKILEPSNLPERDTEIDGYDDEELNVLLQHFGNLTILHYRFNYMYFRVDNIEGSCSSRKLTMKEFWKVVVSKHGQSFPEFVKLAAACLVIPVSTVDCERGFSTQNRIKTKLRNRLKTNRLDQLMRIKIEGPPIREFDFTKAMEMWAHSKTRRIFA